MTGRRRSTGPIARLVDHEAPAERLAAFRVVLGLFVLAYLGLRLPVFASLSDRPAAAFDGVGIFGSADGPLPSAVYRGALAGALVTGVCFLAGYRFPITGPLFAGLVLVLMSYRSSWGQLLHFENLFTLHLLVVGFSPAADAWSLDARRRRPPAPSPRRRRRAGTGFRQPCHYGWPLQLACLVTVVTYAIAGVAKLRYGGLEWVVGDALRNHVAASAARLELLGGRASPLAALAVPHGWTFPPMAAVGLAVELLAPLALLGGRPRTLWVVVTWSMHLGIFALMLVGFPYPLFGVAFAPFFALERLPFLRGVRGPAAMGSRPGVVA